MKRQIKFRGRRLSDHKWEYGFLYREEATACIVRDRGFAREFKQVLPESIGQFTGLLDRNGKEIYEGDIIKDGDYFFEVYWCDSLGSFMHEEYNSKSDTPKIFMMDCLSAVAEIVGNIHEQSKS